MGVQICLKCGQAFEGNQCTACLIRDEDISETSRLSVWVAGFGLMATVFALAVYPPLELMSPAFYIFLGLFFLPAAIIFVLWLCDALTRHVVVSRLLIVFAAGAFVVSATFYFLNGVLDRNSPPMVQAVVSRKEVSSNADGTSYYLECAISWRQKTIEQDIEVSPKTFTAAEPGDSVRVPIHPGAFSMPWYGKGLLSNGHDGIDLIQNRP
jgi:hypothetical protein